MILTGPKIKEERTNGKITITPFDEKYINPNSYDFRLGDTLVVYKSKELDAKALNETETITIPEEGIVLQPDMLYLGYTIETVGSNHYVPILHGKSSTGRMGLFIHITADLVDIGFEGHFTLMMHAVQPLRVYPGMRIGQVTFWQATGAVNLYTGKYQGSSAPMASQVYKDFEQ
jgi:dCTP deaminase